MNILFYKDISSDNFIKFIAIRTQNIGGSAMLYFRSPLDGEKERDVLQRRVMMPIEGLIALPFSGESTGCALHHREKAK
ncbi:hypothetical protein AU512_12470 [Lonsdalea iberica]|uniref:Uncharacterized protein n=1 Tax=Lonsdalea iberica TaxID=1082703 RepID=A0ABX3XDT9_9GAMM|nr:hypothetical protein AU512_12470 [Lonsdalea iberica]